MTARGYFHLVVHSWGWPCDTGAVWWADGNNNTGGCGAHWYSADGRHWQWSATVLDNSTVLFADGTVRDYGRERPKVIMDPTATFPIALMNGAAQHCRGNVGLDSGRPHVHAHCSVSDAHSSAAAVRERAAAEAEPERWVQRRRSMQRRPKSHTSAHWHADAAAIGRKRRTAGGVHGLSRNIPPPLDVVSTAAV